MMRHHEVRVANSADALEAVLRGIERGERPRPDWLHIQGSCRLDRLRGEELGRLVRRIHGCVRQGFKARGPSSNRKNRRLDFWRRIAANGFHDFASTGWTKCYDSPFLQSYDYLGDYLAGGIDRLDPYAVYSAVLGTHDYTVDDFLRTPLCEKVETLVEPMAGTGEFSYCGHFQHPDLRYVMLDLDADARERVLAQPWLEGSDRHYVLADVLEPATWERVRRLTKGRSLSYIGKQSHHFFDARQLHRLLSLGTSSVDYFILETPEPALIGDLARVDLLTRPEMKDAGFETALVETEGQPPNPFTNQLSFRLDVWDETARRTLFHYDDWTSWQPPMLVAIANLLDLEVLYLNEEEGDFLPVEGTNHGDATENVTFMLFRSRR